MNSLYGKFGMSPDLKKLLIFDASTPEKYEVFMKAIDEKGENIHDYTQVGDFFLIAVPTVGNVKYDNELDLYHGMDVNISIAAAITSLGRDLLSFFKNNPHFNLYYCDTDSAIIDRELPDYMVGNELGQLKLEHVIYRAIFLAPKVYGLVTTDGQEIIKVKGLGTYGEDELNINTLENLLIVDSNKTFCPEKWYKNVLAGEVTTTDIAYTLKATNNKRVFIETYDTGVGIYYYNETEPVNFNNINNNPPS
jgi:hypothetical protein